MGPPPVALGGPFAASGAGLVAPEGSSPAALPPRPRPRVASLGALYTFVIVGGIALGGSIASQLLPEWETGRWWILTAVLDAVAVGAATLGVAIGVGALGEIGRHRTVLRGTAAAALGLALACGLFIGGGVRAVDDWYDLDIPDAWDRIDLGQSDGRTLADFVDGARGASTPGRGSLRTEGRVGGCYEGSPSVPGPEVACGEPHTLELVDQIVIPAQEGAGVRARREVGVAECVEALEPLADELPDDGEVTALVPDEVSWLAADRNVVCIFFHPAPVRGALGS